MKILIFSMKILIFSIKSQVKNFVIFSIIFLMIHKIFNYQVKVFTGGVETRWLGWQFLYGL